MTTIRLSYILKNVKNVNDWWILDSDDLTNEILDIDYENIDSLNNLNIINTIMRIHVRIVCYRMYIKYIIGGYNAKKMFKIKYEFFFKYTF